MLTEHDHPFGEWASIAPALSDDAGVDERARAGAAKGVGPGIDGILEKPQNGPVHREPPPGLRRDVPIGFYHRQGDALLSAPQQDLPGTPHLGELREDQDRLLHALIGILLHPSIVAADVPDGQAQHQFAPAGFGEQPLVRPPANPTKLGLTHRPFQAQQEASLSCRGS